MRLSLKVQPVISDIPELFDVRILAAIRCRKCDASCHVDHAEWNEFQAFSDQLESNDPWPGVADDDARRAWSMRRREAEDKWWEDRGHEYFPPYYDRECPACEGTGRETIAVPLFELESFLGRTNASTAT